MQSSASREPLPHQAPPEGAGPLRERAPAGRRRWLVAGLLILAALSVALVAVPLRILRPFAPQSSSGLALAYGAQRVAPAVTLAALLLGAVLAWRLWRAPVRPSSWPGRCRLWLGRLGLVVVLVLAAGAAWLARQDVFETMFRPLPRPGYARVADAGFVAPGDMVLAIEIGGDAVAYPVRQIAYHHVVEDRVGGRAVAVTY
jgi:Protein of unknown function (DUF3179)